MWLLVFSSVQSLTEFKLHFHFQLVEFETRHEFCLNAQLQGQVAAF